MSDNTGTAIAQRESKPADLVRAALERMKPQLAMALPKHLTADRLLRVAMTAVQATPKLLDCDRTSLYRAIMTCAQLGLEPDGVLGQAYLVPFAGKVQFIPGYKGLITLARNSGEVATIIAREVCENDTFEYNQGSGDPPNHPYDFRADRGKVIGFYAAAKFKDGSFQCEPMTIAEIEAIRDRSQGYRYALSTAKKYNKEPDSPWINNFNEMAKKTCIRRLAKYLPMSVQKASHLADSYDTGRHVTLDNHGEIVIEGETQEQEDAPRRVGNVSKLERFEEQHGAVESDRIPTYEEVHGILNESVNEPSQDAPEQRPEPPVETGGHDGWLANFNALAPRQNPDGTPDWKTFVEGAAYLISTAGKEDLAALEVSKNLQLQRLHHDDIELYRALTRVVADRARELAKSVKPA